MPTATMDATDLSDPDLVRRWREQGCLIVRRVWDRARLARLAPVLEAVLAEYRRCDHLETREPGADDSRRVLHPNFPPYLRGDDRGRIELLSAMADARVLEAPRRIFGQQPLFRSAQFWFNPTTRSQDGNWHRDSQFIHPDLDEERAQLPVLSTADAGIQVQIALVANDDVEFVPGSHRRWDTDEEFRIRRADGARNWCSNDMPGAIRVALEPGDAVMFNPFGLHRGRYHADKPRRTLMVTLTSSARLLSDRFSRQPWFLEPGYLDGLDERTTAFYRRFVDTFAAWWRGGAPVGVFREGY